MSSVGLWEDLFWDNELSDEAVPSAGRLLGYLLDIYFCVMEGERGLPKIGTEFSWEEVVSQSTRIDEDAFWFVMVRNLKNLIL